MPKRPFPFKLLPVTKSPDPGIVRIKTEQNVFGLLKTLVVVLLIALQLALLIFLYLRLVEAFGAYLVLSLVLSIVTALDILSSEQSASTKAVWVFVVLILFVVGFIIYYMSDRRVFFAAPKRRYRKIFRRAESYAMAGAAPPSADARAEEDRAYLQKTGNFPAFAGTDARYFPSGGLLFDDILARLRTAEKFIFIEYFCIADGALLERILGILFERAAAGVDVRIIYDDMGSHSTLRRKTKRLIRQKGVRLLAFNKMVPSLNIGLNFRDHRKIVVVDGETAYTGGANLADEYVNERRMYGYWKDAGIRLDGRAVDGFTMIFLRQWEFLSEQEEDYAPFLNLAPARENAAAFVPYACGLDFDDAIGRELYLNVIAKAQRRLLIMTPYLVPDDALMNMLVNKAESGVDVRLILPGVPDKAVVYRLTLKNGERLAGRGVKVYCMKHSFVHSKLMLADYCAVVGSINMDMRSFYEQFESAVYTDDAAVLGQIEEDFGSAFAECEPLAVRRRSLLGRLFDMILRVFAPLM